MTIFRTASVAASPRTCSALKQPTWPIGLSGLVPAQAGVLTFEDLNPSPAAYDAMPASYNGLSFSGWYFGPDTVYAPASGSIDLFTDYADPNDPGNYVITDSNNAVTSTIAFYFTGAYFSGYSGVTFELFKDGALVATSDSLPDSLGPNPYGPTFLASGYAGLIDTVVVRGVQGYYAMDDFTFRLDPTAAVPEPASYALVLVALGSAALARRRSRPGATRH